MNEWSRGEWDDYLPPHLHTNDINTRGHSPTALKLWIGVSLSLFSFWYSSQCNGLMVIVPVELGETKHGV